MIEDFEITAHTFERPKYGFSKQANSLIESGYNLTLDEQRIILACVGMIEFDDPLACVYIIPIKSFNKALNTKGGYLYSNVNKLVGRLNSRRFKIKTKGRGELHTGWVSSIEYKDEDSVIELTFEPKLRPYLLELKKEFTLYLSDIGFRVRSSYTTKLYLLLKQYQSIGRRVFTVDEFRQVFGLGVRQYGDIKQRIIIPSVKEINKSTDIVVVFSAKKTGKKITDLMFEFKKQPYQQSINIPEFEKVEKRELTKENIMNTKLNKNEKHIKIEQTNTTSEQEKIILEIIELTGMTETEILKIIKEKDLENVRESIEYAKRKNQAGEVKKSFGGFVRRAIERDWGVKTKQEREQEEKKAIKAKELKAQEEQKRKEEEEESKRVEFDRERRKVAFDIYQKLGQQERKIIFDSIKSRVGQFDREKMADEGEKSMGFRIRLPKELNDQLPPELQQH